MSTKLDDIMFQQFSPSRDNPAPGRAPAGWTKIGTLYDRIGSCFGTTIYAKPGHEEQVRAWLKESNRQHADHERSYFSQPWV